MVAQVYPHLIHRYRGSRSVVEAPAQDHVDVSGDLVRHDHVLGEVGQRRILDLEFVVVGVLLVGAGADHDAVGVGILRGEDISVGGFYLVAVRRVKLVCPGSPANILDTNGAGFQARLLHHQEILDVAVARPA